MKQYAVIEITNLEPLKIGAGGSGKSQAEQTRNDIPGSAIRGAIISHLLRHKAIDHRSINRVLRDMACYNAYPHRKGKLFVPVPRHLRVNKHEVRQLGETAAPLSNLLHRGKDQGGQDRKNSPEFHFAAFEKEALGGMKIARTYTMHHCTSLNKDKVEKENLFSYQAIVPGYTFRAILALEAELFSEVCRSLLEEDVWYFGGSKGSGYGRCKFNLVSQEKPLIFEQARELAGLAYASDYRGGNKELVLTCLSDCLFRNDAGQPVSHLPERQLTEWIGHQVEAGRCLVQSGLSEGYNSKWQARYPKETTVKAGSILTYRLAESLSDAQLEQVIRKLESRLFGYRTQEGYGWIGVNIHYPAQIKKWEDEAGEPAGETRSQSADGSSLLNEKEEQVQSILLRGLKLTKSDWLREIFRKSCVTHENKREIVLELEKAHHFTVLLKHLNRIRSVLFSEGSSLALKNLNSEELPAIYQKDRNLFSIADCDFQAINSYLTAQTADRASVRYISHWRKLDEFIHTRLKTTKGQLYYPSGEANKTGKKFLLELLLHGLEMERRRDRNGTEA